MTMKACRVHRFGPPDEIIVDDIPQPVPGPGELLVQVKAAGVGPWDGWIRAGKSVLPQPLPLTLGSDLSGIVSLVGPDVTAVEPGDAVYGVTNPRFTDAYAEFAIARATMIAPKPRNLSDVEAASVPVVAVTAWQMLFDAASVTRGQTVLIHGAAGSVGAFAVQMAHQAGARVIATASGPERDAVRALGADEVIDYRAVRFEEQTGMVDVVLDTVGGDTQTRSRGVLSPGGVLVSIVSQPDQEATARHGVRSLFLLVDVTTARLARVTDLLETGALKTNVGAVLPLAGARAAHEMLEGLRPRPRGKIMLAVSS